MSFLCLSHYYRDELYGIMDVADYLRSGTYPRRMPLEGRTILTIFPESSIRTRVTFEAAIKQLGAVHLSLPPASLEKGEPLGDIARYLDCWIHMLVLRYPDLGVVRELAGHLRAPVVNAMTNDNHPCEVLTDLTTLRQQRGDLASLRLVFVGPRGNVGNSWFHAAGALGLNLTQVCPPGYEVDRGTLDFARSRSPGSIEVTHDMKSGIRGADVVLTDCWPRQHDRAVFLPYQVNQAAMALAARDAVLNPCPPVTRGNEVSAEVMDSHWFIGYQAKENLLHVQKAIILHCLGLDRQ